jgi:hypothetical protein
LVAEFFWTVSFEVKTPYPSSKGGFSGEWSALAFLLCLYGLLSLEVIGGGAPRRLRTCFRRRVFGWRGSLGVIFGLSEFA